MKRLIIAIIALSLGACAQQTADTTDGITTSPMPSNPMDEMTREATCAAPR